MRWPDYFVKVAEDLATGVLAAGLLVVQVGLHVVPAGPKVDPAAAFASASTSTTLRYSEPRRQPRRG